MFRLEDQDRRDPQDYLDWMVDLESRATKACLADLGIMDEGVHPVFLV